MRVAVLHADVPEGAPLDELDTLVQVAAVSRALEALGHQAVAVPCGLDLGAVEARLRDLAPDAVFNLVESLSGAGRYLPLVPAVVERLGLPMTGATGDGLYLTSNKLVSKAVLRAAGLPVPDWVSAADLAAGGSLPRGRLILKSVWEHASLGLDDDAIVDPVDGAALVDALASRLGALGGEAFAEVYIPGREFNVSVMAGPRVLPVAEIAFRDFPDGKPQMVGYAAKWDEGSFEYQHTVRVFPEGDEALLARLEALSLQAWGAFGLTGYARVDFRVDAAGRPWILEVNANPCLSPDAGFAAAAERSGLSHQALIGAILDEALGRPLPGLRLSGGVMRPRPVPGRQVTVSLREALRPDDRGAIEEIVRATGFFSHEEVEIAVELVDDHLEKGLEGGYHFLLAEREGRVVGYACYGQVPATTASWDLYWIATHPDQQGTGLGRVMVDEVADRVRALGGEVLFAETSGRPQYAPTRGFYLRTHFTQAALFPDFYAPGDDRVVYALTL